ncbi:SusC/RagA family TonB-linked outer membrane protein [Chitinophaga niabensis]|nr:SusC/RagA family TonB-linked outer membrane protein [Chitinophaga niabensis]
MNTILKGRNVSWALKDRTIIITKRVVVAETGNNTVVDTIPNVNISGSIVDKSGIPIVGATVSLKGQTMGQATDNLGQFRFINIPSSATLIVSSVGYKMKQVRLGGETAFRITLDSAITEIQKVEVVSNGYQVMSKERVTGSFVNIDNELFNRRVGATVLDRIADLVPGLIIANGGNSNPLDDIKIRGTSTISASKRPLLVVDNFIFDGDPNSLNPNDVESITVLRDAAAASIWGVRAGNGVIVISMKKGKLNSRPVVSFNSNITITERPNLFDIPVVSSAHVIALEKKRFQAGFYDQALAANTFPALSQVVEILSKRRAGTISSAEADAMIESYANHDIRNDINRYLLQTPVSQQHALNISGGGESYQYYGSIGYDRNRPLDINSTNERLTMRFNNIWRPSRNLQIRAEINWGQSNVERKNSVENYQLLLTAPYHRLSDEQGNALAIPKKYRLPYVDTVKFPGQLDWHYKPIEEASNGNYNFRNYNTRINSGLSYTLIPGLKAEINYQWQKNYYDEKRIYSITTFYTRDLINRVVTSAGSQPNYPYPLGGVYGRSNGDQKSWNVRGLLNFDRGFGIHNISAIVGLEASELVTEAWTMPAQYGYNPETNTFGVPKFGNWITRPNQTTEAISYSAANLRGTINRFGSCFGNIAYDFDGRYLIYGSGKIDQSNFFGVKANDRKVPLWSAGVAWKISQESFYNLDFLPSLKFKATFGYNGNVNAGISPLATANYFSLSSALQVPYASISTPPNPQLRWERVKNVNFGMDFESKQQRLSGSIEFYHKQGIDLISRIDADPTSGFTSYTGNKSSLQTRGIDLSLTSRNISREFKWYTTLILSYQREKVTAYSVKPPDQGLVIGSVIVGKPLNNIYSYKWAGLNPQNGDSRFYLNKDIMSSIDMYKVKQADLVYGGQLNPPIFGAARNDFSYRSLNVSVNITYQLGHHFRRKSFSGYFGTATDYASWQHKDYLDAWKVPGDEMVTNVPGFLDTYSDNRYALYNSSDILLEKGDVVRLQDIKISYEIGKSAIRKLFLSNVSFYLYMNNVGILWKASVFNPDTEGGLNISRPKSLAFGVNIGF